MVVSEPSSTWYRTREGQGVVAVYIVLVLATVVASTGAVTVPVESIPVLAAVFDLSGELQPVPLVVYVASTVGALLWGLRAIVRRGDQSETAPTDGGGSGDSAESRSDSAESRTVFAGEPRELLFRPFAALPLAAGVYLMSGIVAGGSGPSTTATAVLSLFVGLYLHRAYDRLGRIADSLRRGPESDRADPSTATSGTWHHRPYGAVLVSVYLVGAVGLVVLTTHEGLVGDAGLASLPVPGDIYLYALLGVLGRVFTELIRERDVSVTTLALRGVRVPMAMLLAGAIYIVVGLPSVTAAYPLVGLAFVVGLYEGVGFHYIAAVGQRLLPTPREQPPGGEVSSTGASGSETADGETDGSDGSTEEPPEAETQG